VPRLESTVGLADRVPEVLGSLGDLGLVCLVKIDGEREHKQWTVVISGEPLVDSFVRIDGNSLEYCLTKALARLREILPTVPGFD
jgi:hypothetical protein